MELKVVPPHEWSQIAELAHKIAFQEILPKDRNRIDFTLLAVEGNTPLGYVTCRETDSETLYWQFGGSMPGTKDTVKSWRVLTLFKQFTLSRYKRLHMLIENTNAPMLKMAAKLGCRITGVRVYRTTVLLEHCLEAG